MRDVVERTVRAYIGLGGNVGDVPTTMAAAIHALTAFPSASLDGVSRLYTTRPVGVEDQPEFHNAVVALDVPEGPDPQTGALALLIGLKNVERAFGRQKRRRWGPRELDLDLLIFGPEHIVVPRPEPGQSADPSRGDAQWLEVPHPSAAERLFVLAPLADLAPDLVPPGWRRSVAATRDERAAVEGPGAVHPVAIWDGQHWLPDLTTSDFADQVP